MELGRHGVWEGVHRGESDGEGRGEKRGEVTVVTRGPGMEGNAKARLVSVREVEGGMRGGGEGWMDEREKERTMDGRTIGHQRVRGEHSDNRTNALRT
jgi:hypothetical protein